MRVNSCPGEIWSHYMVYFHHALFPTHSPGSWKQSQPLFSGNVRSNPMANHNAHGSNRAGNCSNAQSAITMVLCAPVLHTAYDDIHQTNQLRPLLHRASPFASTRLLDSFLELPCKRSHASVFQFGAFDVPDPPVQSRDRSQQSLHRTLIGHWTCPSHRTRHVQPSPRLLWKR